MPIVEARSGAAVVGARRSLMPALGTWGFIVTFSGQGLRNLVGWWAFGVIAAISGLMLFAVFVREGHRVPWRALPPNSQRLHRPVHAERYMVPLPA